jgi:hypothetical protein
MVMGFSFLFVREAGRALRSRIYSAGQEGGTICIRVAQNVVWGRDSMVLARKWYESESGSPGEWSRDLLHDYCA